MPQAESTKSTSKQSSVSDKSAHIEEGLNHIIVKAVGMGASAIHIEPRDRFVWVRFRVGNQLQLGTKLPIDTLKPLSMAGKSLAGLTEDETRPQEGVFDYDVNGHSHVIRLSIVPVVDGEKMVFHLSYKSHAGISLKQMGYWGENLKRIEQTLGQLRGMVVIASSDRSSGLLTLSALVRLLSHPSLNMAVVGESLTEYLAHSGQPKVQSLKGLSSDRTLKILLRDDPDVIVLDDLSDSETVKAAFQAAAKHIVIVKTLATDSVSLLQRLSNIGLEPTALYSYMKLAASQTALRRLCPKCRSLSKLPVDIKEQLDELNEDFPFQLLHELEENAREAGIGGPLNELNTPSTEITHLWQANANGCNECNYSGYSGYTTINEVVDVTSPDVQKHLTQSGAKRLPLLSAALDTGMIPKIIDGIIKSMRGEVAIDDVFKAIQTIG